MNPTFKKLLDDFNWVRKRQYRSDPEREEAVNRAIAHTMQIVLEKLRDGDRE